MRAEHLEPVQTELAGMALRDFQTALGRLVRAPDGRDPLGGLCLDERERASIETLSHSAGFRFTVDVQRSWCVGRAMNAGTMTLSILAEDVRRQLLEAWTNAGGGTSSFFAAEADALFDFIAARLPDPSHELTACRFEQATLRANEKAPVFTPPELVAPDAPRCALRRGLYAGMVLFHGDPAAILDALLTAKPLPPISAETNPILLSPGLDRLWRPASRSEVELWDRLAAPSSFLALLQEGFLRDTIESLLRAGALEYVD
jgi:hypothetical protein